MTMTLPATTPLGFKPGACPLVAAAFQHNCWEGAWIWVANGQRLRTTQFWRPGAPDNANDGEHCAQLSNEIDFGWDDVACSTEAHYFCQLPHPN
ncbi:hypothetical protein MRX96_055242 [Rhipicephalus microplus]